MRRLVLVLILAFWAVPVVGQEYVGGAGREQRWKLLRGLQGVLVVVEDLPPAVEDGGLTVSVIQAAVEERLRAAGVPVLSREEWSETPRQAFLHVSVKAMKDGGGFPSPYSIDVSLREAVTLFSTPAMRTHTVTWRVYPPYGSVEESSLRDLQGDVIRMVDEFTDEFLRANPKE